MISRAIYFIDSWITTNLRFDARDQDANPEQLAKQCIDDAAKLGISSGELEENLGTDLVDFIAHELESARPNQLPSRTRRLTLTKTPSDLPTSASGSDS